MPTWRLGEISLSELTSVQVAMATDVPDSHWPEGSLGVVAIDDLAISVGACSGSEWECFVYCCENTRLCLSSNSFQN